AVLLKIALSYMICCPQWHSKGLLDTKSTDRKQTLLHYISNVVKEKYQQVSLFYNELHYVEKAAAVSLENVLLDVKELQRGLDLTKREYTMHDHNTMLKEFIQNNEGKLKKLQDDAKIAQDAFDDAVKYFGENPKTTPPSVFFPVFVRFVKAYKQAEEENELRKKQEQALMEKLLEQEALLEQQDQKSPSHKTKRQQQELIAELRRRQVKDNRHVYEGKDGAIEDIITALKKNNITKFPNVHSRDSCAVGTNLKISITRMIISFKLYQNQSTGKLAILQLFLKNNVAHCGTTALIGYQQDTFSCLDPDPEINLLLIFVFNSTDLRNQPYRRADAVRRSVRRRFDDQNLRSLNGAEIAM
ncbi:UNVERIFIED_CONTAM: Formin-like protein 2, partial [Gekko kuhli]